MRTVPVILMLLLSVLCAVPAKADAPLGPEEFTSIDELALAVAAYFPKVQGPVTAVQGETVTIGLGKKNGILPNMVLTVWRDGRDVLHPVTGAVIGRTEDEVGSIEVTGVAESTATAVMKKQVLEPKAGDRARITPRKINLALLPLRDDRPDVIQTLGERLGELGRFTVLEQPKVSAFLKDRKSRDATLVRELGGAFVLDSVVAVSILPSDGKLLTTTRIFYADDAKPLDTIVAMLNLATKRELFGDVRPFFSPLKETAVPGDRIPDLPVAARLFAVADLDGDGAAEYAFSDGSRLSVFRLDQGAWKELWIEAPPSRERDAQQFALSAADINGNGRAEIFVTRMLNGTVSSYVVEFREGSYGRIADIPGFLRVMTAPGRAAVLIGQGYDPATFYAGSPREHAWNGSGYAAGAALPLPKQVSLYGFVVGNLGEARSLLVALEKDGKLAVYAGGDAVWRSEERYYPMAATVIKPLSGIDAAVGRVPGDLDSAFNTQASYAEDERKEKVPGRILAFDLDGNGSDEVIIPKNTPHALLGGYKAGTLEGLGWTGTRLEPRWSMKDIAGPVLDIQVVPQQGGAQVYALVQIAGSFFSKDAFRIERFGGK